MIEVWFESSYKTDYHKFLASKNMYKEHGQGVFYKSKEKVKIYDPVTKKLSVKLGGDLEVGDIVKYQRVDQNKENINSLREIVKIIERKDLDQYDLVGFGKNLSDIYPDTYIRNQDQNYFR
jgi:hypothetical protein